MSRSASFRSSSAKGAHPATSTDDDVLRETRKLLNALNEENAELKSQNDILCDKLRRASDAVSTSAGERDALEQDMKDINFNLMQQLRTKSAALKDIESKLEEVVQRERTASKDFQRSERQREELESELMILRERLTVSDDTHRKAQRKLEDVSSNTEDTRSKVKELQGEVARLRQTLQECKADRDATQTAAEAFRREVSTIEDAVQEEHRVAVDSLTRQIAALTAQANRAVRAESEVLFAHGEMSQMASVSYDQLVAFQQQLGNAIEAVAGFDATLGAQLSRVQEISHQLVVVRQHDDLVISYLVDDRRSSEEELRTLRRTVEHLQGEVTTSTVARDGTTAKYERIEQERRKLEERVAELEGLLDEATQSSQRLQVKLRDAERCAEQERSANDDAKKALAEADAALEISAHANARLEQDLIRERTLATQQKLAHQEELHKLINAHHDMTAQLQSDMEALEEENDALQEQVREHADTLAHALSRLATSHNAGRRSLSHRSHRSISTDSTLHAPTTRPPPERHAPQRPAPPLASNETIATIECDESEHLSRSIDAAVAKAQVVARRSPR
jgi:chromosome segregation ATPase